MTWEIRYRGSVEKDVSRLPERIRAVALEKIVALAHDPFAVGCKKLKGQENRFRIRIARDYRVVYSLLREERLVIIEFVGHRKDAYRCF